MLMRTTKFLEIGNSLIVIEKQQAILQQNVLDSFIVIYR